MKKRVIFIPVETISRELDYKIVLALDLLAKDNIILLGQHNFLDSIMGFFKNGTYIGKHVFKDSFPTSFNLYKRYKKNNFSILWMHEEGGIYAGDRKNWKKVLDELLDPSALNKDDAILTWGEFQKMHYGEMSSASSINVGVPRFNLSQGTDLRKIITKFNRVKERDYVLINTNFSTVNYHSDRKRMLRNLIESFINVDDNMKLARHFASQNKIFGHFINLVTDLASNHPEQLFVFRPHPTESSKIYKLLFSALPNVLVTKQFSAVEWMDQCKCLIQNGCTTSLEAYFMGKRIINFFPFEDRDSINITRELGVSCSSSNEVEEVIFYNALNPKDSLDSFEELPELIHNLNPLYSQDIFIDELNKLINSKDLFTFNAFFLKIRIKVILYLANFINAVKYIPRYFLFRTKWEDYKMFISHFPGFSKLEIENKFNFLSKEKSKSPRLTFFGKNLIMISQSNNK